MATSSKRVDEERGYIIGSGDDGKYTYLLAKVYTKLTFGQSFAVTTCLQQVLIPIFVVS